MTRFWFSIPEDVYKRQADQDEKMTIGVSVYNLNDAEVREFRNYFENYVGMAFEVEFLYSSSIRDVYKRQGKN